MPWNLIRGLILKSSVALLFHRELDKDGKGIYPLTQGCVEVSNPLRFGRSE